MEKTKIVIDEKVLEKIPDETTNGAKTRKSPVPQSYERIEAGVLKLSFEDEVKLFKVIKEDIKSKLDQKEAAFKTASELVKE